MTGDSFDLTAIVQDVASDGGVEHGALLTRFVDAMLQGTPEQAEAARRDVRDALGDAAFVDACATVASFNAVVKIADGSGIPLEEIKARNTEDIRESLGIERYQENS